MAEQRILPPYGDVNEACNSCIFEKTYNYDCWDKNWRMYLCWEQA